MRDGGDAVSNYVIEYRETGTFKWTRANIGEKTPDARYKVTGLHRGREYEFRVAAANRAGIGAFCDASSPITTEDPMGMWPFTYQLYFNFAQILCCLECICASFDVVVCLF